jgi:hypothetical protein
MHFSWVNNVVVPWFGVFLLKDLPQSARMVCFSSAYMYLCLCLFFGVVGSWYTVGRFSLLLLCSLFDHVLLSCRCHGVVFLLYLCSLSSEAELPQFPRVAFWESVFVCHWPLQVTLFKVLKVKLIRIYIYLCVDSKHLAAACKGFLQRVKGFTYKFGGKFIIS